MNYTGASCSICGQKFTDTDDVVVCPDCGTPYHRACYKEVGHCTAQELHETGGEWVNPVKPAKKEEAHSGIWPCPNCGLMNSADAERCDNCGFPKALDKRYQQEHEHAQEAQGEHGHSDPYNDPFMDPYSLAYAPIDPNSTIKSVPVKDLMAFTRKNSEYYVRMFKLMAANIGARVFNWSALLFGPFYFLYRKMHRKGVLLLMILLAAYMPKFALIYHLMPQIMESTAQLMSTDLSQMMSYVYNFEGLDFILTLTEFASYIPFVLHIYCGFTANMSYFKHTIESMHELGRQSAGDRGRLEQLILKQGGVSVGSVVLGMAFSAVLFLTISTVIVLKFL